MIYWANSITIKKKLGEKGVLTMPPQMNYKYEEKKHFSFCNQVAFKQAGSAAETSLTAEHLFIAWLALICVDK